jgi:uncharacterized protein YkwD
MGVAKVTFIPHHGNNHWPLALRHRTLAYVSSFLVLTKIVAISALALTPNTAALSTITESRMIQLTNDARIKNGLPALAVNSKLTQAAKLKGQDMLKNQYFAHISPTGVTPWFWMKKTGYSYQVAGENLAIDFLDGEDVVAAWLASPTHKANMLHTEYTETGIAVVSGEFQQGTSIIIVHMFGKPLAQEATSTVTVASLTPAPAVAGLKENAPTPTPSPTTTPVISPDEPRTPRISLLHEPTDSEDSVTFRVEGDKGHALVLLIDNQERSITTLPDSGFQDISLPAKNLPTGTLMARVFTRSVQGVQSKVSPPLSFVNPEATPAASYTLALSPAFDRQQIALVGTSSSEAWQLFPTNVPLTINAHTINVTPSFTMHEQEAAKSFSSTIVHATRQFTSLILVVVALLLVLTIVVRIRVQHPALIMHASMVIFLAVTLLLA